MTKFLGQKNAGTPCGTGRGARARVQPLDRAPPWLLHSLTCRCIFCVMSLCLLPRASVTYVAPEVVLNKGEDPATREGYNKKADVWSLGVILYILYVPCARRRRWWLSHAAS